MTSSISAAAAILSVMTDEGVSGEIATPSFHLPLMNGIDKWKWVRCVIKIVHIGSQFRIRKAPTSCLHVETVKSTARISYIVDPLVAQSVPPCQRHEIRPPTFSGCATIMWQSMNIPGTPFDTQDRMGAPNITTNDGSAEKSKPNLHDIPIVMLGTK